MDTHISRGFLYTLWDDQLTIKEGEVLRSRWSSRREALFRYGIGDGDYTICSPVPEMIFRAKIWLPERNDDLAREILTSYHESCIEDLQKKIASHEAKIKILKGDL